MKLVLLFTAALTLSACSRKADNDRQQLLWLHEQLRKNHLSKNAKAMAEGFASDFISINRGQIDSSQTFEDHFRRLQKYFDAVEFVEWGDVNPPLIRFSDDHSLAYIIVDNQVVLNTKDNAGNEIQETTRFAWTSIFRKRNGLWQLECVTSTNQPEVVRPM